MITSEPFGHTIALFTPKCVAEITYIIHNLYTWLNILCWIDGSHYIREKVHSLAHCRDRNTWLYQCTQMLLTSLTTLSSVFCCRAGSGYPNRYSVLGNSRGGFPLPSSRFVIKYCDQSFPSPWHCLYAAPSLSGATPLSILKGVPLSAGGCRSASAICQSLTLADPTTHVGYLFSWWKHSTSLPFILCSHTCFKPYFYCGCALKLLPVLMFL